MPGGGLGSAQSEIGLLLAGNINSLAGKKQLLPFLKKKANSVCLDKALASAECTLTSFDAWYYSELHWNVL